MHTLRLSQRELSGSLSSQGHSLNRLKRRRGDLDLPRPLIYDRAEDAYVWILTSPTHCGNWA